MPVINMQGLNTQTAPMDAIADVLKDYHEDFMSPKEALAVVTAIVIEWQQ